MLALLLLAALAGEPGPALPRDSLACRTMNIERLPLATRQSPLDSLSFAVGRARVKLCYGRPSLRGRTVFGGLVPYGKLWRTGANEPTMIHTTAPILVAGVPLPAGSYSIYTVPGPAEWEVILNRSITQWGHESQYTDAVRRQEIGRGSAKAESSGDLVETLTFRVEPSPEQAAVLLLEWERTRVRIPLGPGS